MTAVLLWAGGSYAETPSAPGLQPLDCVINPSVVADLGSGVPGILSAVTVDRSDLVQQGQVVAELESSVEALALELARARAEMEAEIDLRRVNAAFGQRQHKRTEDLYRRKVISTNDMDERKTEARLASLQLRQAIENQELAKLEEQRAEKVLHRRAIESPISGVVMERFKTIGEYVEDQPVLRVAQLDPLHVEVFVPVEQLGAVSQGMQAEVWSDAVPGTQWKAKVSRVDRVADVASGTYGVRLELPNPDYKVPAGLRCRVQFVDGPALAEQPAPAGQLAMPAVAAADVHGAVGGSSNSSVGRAVPAGAPVVRTPGPAGPAATPEASRAASAKAKTAARAAPGSVAAATDRVTAATRTVSAPTSQVTRADATTAATVPTAMIKGPAPTPRPVKATVAQAAPKVDKSPAKAAATAEPASAPPAAVARVRADSQASTKTAQADTPASGSAVKAQAMLPARSLTDSALPALATAPALPRCQLAGPFADEAIAQRKARALTRRGLTVKVEERSGWVKAGLRVLSPPVPSRAAADTLYARMKAAGFTDLYIAPRGKYKNRVALGLYHNERPARERVEEIRAKGFEAELQPWLKRDTEYFLAIRGVPTAEAAKMLGALPVPATDGAFENGACDQLASR